MNRVSSVSSSRRALRSSIPKSVTVTPCAHWWTPLASSLPPADGCPLHDAQRLMPLRPFMTVWPSTPHFRTWESAVDGNPHPHGHPQLGRSSGGAGLHSKSAAVPVSYTHLTLPT